MRSGCAFWCSCFVLLLSFLPRPAVAQTVSGLPADLARFETFFTVAVKLDKLSHTTFPQLDGSSYKPVFPRMGDLIGLSDREVSLVMAAAQQCVTDVRNLLKPSPAIFEARLTELEIDSLSATTPIEGKLQERKREIVSGHLDRLKLAMGPTQFQKLVDYLRNPKWEQQLAMHLVPALR